MALRWSSVRCARPVAGRQAVAGQEDVAAFQAAIVAAIKVIVKGTGIGHIALVPVEDCFGRRYFFGNVFSHGICR